MFPFSINYASIWLPFADFRAHVVTNIHKVLYAYNLGDFIPDTLHSILSAILICVIGKYFHVEIRIFAVSFVQACIYMGACACGLHWRTVDCMVRVSFYLWKKKNGLGQLLWCKAWVSIAVLLMVDLFPYNRATWRATRVIPSY